MKTRLILLAAMALFSATANAQVTFKNPAPFTVQYALSCATTPATVGVAGKAGTHAATTPSAQYETMAARSSRESCGDAERQIRTFLASPEACSMKKTGVLTASHFVSTPSCPTSTMSTEQPTAAATKK